MFTNSMSSANRLEDELVTLLSLMIHVDVYIQVKNNGLVRPRGVLSLLARLVTFQSLRKVHTES